MATQIATVKSDEGIVKNDQGLIQSVKVNLIYCHITAPITGRIGLRLVDPGNIVQTSDTTGLLVITQLQPISVIFTIAEDQLPIVYAKQRAGQKLPVDAFDREMKTKIASGTLSTIDNEIDQTTGTVKLRATFDNTHNELFPNQFVNARLLQQEKRGVILVPSAAVQRNSSSTYVYVVKPDSTVTVRQVKVSTSDDNNTEITSGVVEGDVVVLTGVDKLQEGSKVTVHLEGAPNAGNQPREIKLRESNPSEPVANIYPAAGSHHAAYGRHFACGRRGVSRVAGFGFARSGLPHHPSDHHLSGRESRCDGVVRYGALGTPIRPSARPAADDFHQLRGAVGHHAANSISA